MITQQELTSSDVFRALADPTRRAILDLLRQGDCSAGKIAESFPVSRPAISRQLRLLRSMDLVIENRTGRSHIYSLNPLPLSQLDEWLRQYRQLWQRNPVRVKQVVEPEERKPKGSGRGKR